MPKESDAESRLMLEKAAADIAAKAEKEAPPTITLGGEDVDEAADDRINQLVEARMQQILSKTALGRRVQDLEQRLASQENVNRDMTRYGKSAKHAQDLEDLSAANQRRIDRSTIERVFNGGGRAWVVIHESPDSMGGADPVPLGHNGNFVWVKRGVPTEISYKHLSVLMEGVVISEIEENMPGGGSVTRFQRSEQYPYRILDGYAAAEAANAEAARLEALRGEIAEGRAALAAEAAG